MNNFVKIASGLLARSNASKGLKSSIVTRNLWHMTKKNTDQDQFLEKQNIFQNAGSKMMMHSKSERELVEFLSEEIIAERKTSKQLNVVNHLEGFDILYDGADVSLVKKGEKEKVVINLNVNHTVDSEDSEGSLEETVDPNKEGVEMRSKPQFEVDIIKGNTTLSFTCSYLDGAPEDGEYNDIFGIDEFCIYENEWNDKVYAVAGDVLDGYLYDLLMNLLEEKGVNNEFALKLANMATAYEHASYIQLLEKLSKFTTVK